MTVAELITELQKLPQDAKVFKWYEITATDEGAHDEGYNAYDKVSRARVSTYKDCEVNVGDVVIY